MKLPSKNYERRLFKNGYKNIAAVDEVGMGPLAGPVFVCAVSINKKLFKKSVRRKQLLWLRDSKQLSARKRQEYFEYLTKIPEVDWKISFSYPKTIDRLNIYQTARKAMIRAINRLKKKPDIVLVDGKTEIKNLNIKQIPIVKGDRYVFSIACASLIAKVLRDRYMEKAAKKFPDYGFEKHKGYATKFHRQKLRRHGPSPIHRISFKPVGKYYKLTK